MGSLSKLNIEKKVGIKMIDFHEIVLTGNHRAGFDSTDDVKSLIEKGIDEDMQCLVQSIASDGLLQPLLVKEEKDGEYELIAGHRRYTALYYLIFVEKRELGRIPVNVVASDKDKDILQLTENLQRKNLSVDEEEAAIEKIYKIKVTENPKLTKDDFALIVKKSKSWISQFFGGMEIKTELKNKGFEVSGIPVTVLYELRNFEKEEQSTIFKNLLNYKKSVFGENEKISRNDIRNYKKLIQQKQENIKSEKIDIELNVENKDNLPLLKKDDMQIEQFCNAVCSDTSKNQKSKNPSIKLSDLKLIFEIWKKNESETNRIVADKIFETVKQSLAN